MFGFRVPIIAVSNEVTFNNTGAKIIVPIISMHAGTKHIRIVGLPDFFKSLTSNDKPALVKMITNTICRNA